MFTKNTLIQEYNNNELSFREIGKKYDCSGNTVRYYFNKYNLKVRTKEEALRPKDLNYNYFKIWTPNMAWILGFIHADGNLENTKYGYYRIKIELQKLDENILEFIRDEICKSYKITHESKICSFTGKPTYSCTLRITSKTIFNDLKNLGITECKSLIKRFCNVPKEYINHYIRGYFDGNGSVGIYNYNDYNRYRVSFSSGSKAMLEEISKYININKILQKENSKCFNLISETKRDFVFLYNYMYSNGGFYLKRKKDKFEELI